ncbi:hypothetical protein CLOM_g11990, partial [Closterium sp. NIES-68]
LQSFLLILNNIVLDINGRCVGKDFGGAATQVFFFAAAEVHWWSGYQRCCCDDWKSMRRSDIFGRLCCFESFRPCGCSSSRVE